MALPALTDSSGRLTDCIYFGDPVLAATSLVTLSVGVLSDVGTADTGVVQPFLWVSVAGGGPEVKLGSANGDLCIMDGAVRVASFGSGNGGSVGQSRFLGPVFQDFPVTEASGLVEAFRITAASDRTTGSPLAALNITNATDGSAVTCLGVYHGLQVNIASAAPNDIASVHELGGIVSFVKQTGVSCTSTVAFDGSAQVANDALGPVANLVGFNIGVKNDYLGAVNGTQVYGTYVRQAGVGTSGSHGGAGGGLNAHVIDRPNFWDHTTGTIEAAAGTTIAGTATAWTTVPKGTEGDVSLLGKWITWTSTAGPVVSKRITVVNNATTLTVTPAIAAGEVVAAGAAYRILAADPWDVALSVTGQGPTPCLNIYPDQYIAPSAFAGVMAVQTAVPGSPADKFGWTWDGVANYSALKTDHSLFQPPFVIPRVSLANVQSVRWDAATPPVDITGVTTTFTPTVDCEVIINFGADISYTSGSGTITILCYVNGVASATKINAKQVAVGERGAYAQFATAALTAGTAYTIKLMTQASDSAIYSLAADHTGMAIMALGKV